jgi:hypothetical protein
VGKKLARIDGLGKKGAIRETGEREVDSEEEPSDW